MADPEVVNVRQATNKKMLGAPEGCLVDDAGPRRAGARLGAFIGEACGNTFEGSGTTRTLAVKVFTKVNCADDG